MKQKALSAMQPWPWLLTNIDPATGKAYKPVENRDKKTSHRGPLIIHASRTFDQDGYDWVRDTFPEIPMPAPSEFQMGGIVGQVNITDCVDTMDSKWFFGDYGYVCEDAKTLPFTPYRGMPGFFYVELPS